MASRSETARVRTDPRISRRRKAIARSKRKRIAASMLGIALLGVAIWGAFWSPLLTVKSVQVVGAKHTGRADVRDVVALGADDNLLLVSTGRVADAAETLPWIKAAEVHRRLPGTVRIRVIEYKPALVVTVVAGTWTISSTGRVLEEGAVSPDLPTLTGAVLPELEPGQRLVTEDVATGLEVWRSLPGKVRTRVASVVAPSRERVALALDDGTLVRFGGSERLAAKNKVLVALLSRLAADGRTATYIDVSVPSTPAVGPAPAATPQPTPQPTPSA